MAIVKVSLTKAQEIAHEIRRVDRAEKLKPHDEVIALNIPGIDVAAEEASRQSIRDANATVQTDIDAATDEVVLKQILVDAGMVQ